jgi:hypothetical protein
MARTVTARKLLKNIITKEKASLVPKGLRFFDRGFHYAMFAVPGCDGLVFYKRPRVNVVIRSFAVFILT